MRDLKMLKEKFDFLNWEHLQEPLRLLFIFIVLWVILFQVAYAKAQVLDQDQHNRVLIFEGWRGAYIKSELNKTVGTLRFSFCGASENDTCVMIGKEIPIEKISSYNEALLANLKEVRDEFAAQVDEGFWRFFTGDSSSNADVKAVDQIIAEIEAGGIENWVLMTEENIRANSPEIESSQLADELAAAMSRTFAVQEAN